jgi:hypothetical protein
MKIRCFFNFRFPSEVAAVQPVFHVTSSVSLLTVASHGAPLRPPEEVSEKTARFVRQNFKSETGEGTTLLIRSLDRCQRSYSLNRVSTIKTSFDTFPPVLSA